MPSTSTPRLVFFTVSRMKPSIHKRRTRFSWDELSQALAAYSRRCQKWLSSIIVCRALMLFGCVLQPFLIFLLGFRWHQNCLAHAVQKFLVGWYDCRKRAAQLHA